MSGYWRIGPAIFGRDTDISQENEIEIAYMRLGKFQIVCEWRTGWHEISMAWG